MYLTRTPTFVGQILLVHLCVIIFGNVHTTEIERKDKCQLPKNVDLISKEIFLHNCILGKYGDIFKGRCYEELGCFETKAPWFSLLQRPFPIPYPPEDVDVGITLYTRDTRNDGYKITLWPEITLSGSDFNSKRPANVFITHGFAGNGNVGWLSEMKDAYLDGVDANVFIVGWGDGATTINYLQAGSNTRIVGAEIARFFKFLVINGVKGSSFHLIGHSLGSHIMAYAANGIKSVTTVKRITALDPAQPGFEKTSTDVRIDKDDAENVDVIHTDAKPTIPFLGFGMMQPAGDVDFYMNGGANQPGCKEIKIPKFKSIEELAHLKKEAIKRIISCSHGRAVDYFIWSLKLKNCTMWGRKMSKIENFLKLTTLGTLNMVDVVLQEFDKCDEETCSALGFNTFQMKARGLFAVTTSADEPYCLPPKNLSKKLENLVSGIFEKIFG